MQHYCFCCKTGPLISWSVLENANPPPMVQCLQWNKVSRSTLIPVHGSFHSQLIAAYFDQELRSRYTNCVPVGRYGPFCYLVHAYGLHCNTFRPVCRPSWSWAAGVIYATWKVWIGLKDSYKKDSGHWRSNPIPYKRDSNPLATTQPCFEPV